jgi:hypothetical protein
VSLSLLARMLALTLDDAHGHDASLAAAVAGVAKA